MHNGWVTWSEFSTPLLLHISIFHAAKVGGGQAKRCLSFDSPKFLDQKCWWGSLNWANIFVNFYSKIFQQFWFLGSLLGDRIVFLIGQDAYCGISLVIHKWTVLRCTGALAVIWKFKIGIFYAIFIISSVRLPVSLTRSRPFSVLRFPGPF